MTNILLFEWSFEPSGFFEERTEFQSSGYSFMIDAGTAKARLSIEDEPWNLAELRTEIEQRLGALFLAAQVLGHRSYKLNLDKITLLREDGSTGSFIVAKSATMAITCGRVDFQTADSAGNVVQDSRRGRIQLRNWLAQAAAAHIEDPVVDSILRSYAAAVNDPRNELIHLYEVREALAEHFHADGATKEKLIGGDRWRRLRKLANQEPLLQGRYRGEHLQSLRPASEEDLTEARSAILALAFRPRMSSWSMLEKHRCDGSEPQRGSEDSHVEGTGPRVRFLRREEADRLIEALRRRS
jgi:hypothetical protein